MSARVSRRSFDADRREARREATSASDSSAAERLGLPERRKRASSRTEASSSCLGKKRMPRICRRRESCLSSRYSIGPSAPRRRLNVPMPGSSTRSPCDRCRATNSATALRAAARSDGVKVVAWEMSACSLRSSALLWLTATG